MEDESLFFLNLVILLISMGLAVYFMQLIKSFGYMNLSELKRRSKMSQKRAQKILKVRMYGLKLWLILWLMLSIFLILIIEALDSLINNFWLTLPAYALILIGLVFVLPWSKWPRPSLRLAAAASPILAFILDKLQILFKPFAPLNLSQRIGSDRPLYIHSRENLMEIIADLKSRTSDQKIAAHLDFATAALAFSSKKVKDLVAPLSALQTVSLERILSPKFMNELHNLGQVAFPVKHPKNKDICGFLYFHDVKLLNASNQFVKDVMRPDIYYVNASDSLITVLDAFIKTQQHLFLVLNKNGKVMGLITISDVLSQYFPEDYINEFNTYDDLEAVARLALHNNDKSKKEAGKHGQDTV